jgi:UDP-N-acetylmuramyl tripeptide synthase
MELKRLIEGVEIERITGETLKEIEGIAYHSQQVKKGFLFAAVRGLKADGHRFIEDALEGQRLLSRTAGGRSQRSLQPFTGIPPPG